METPNAEDNESGVVTTPAEVNSSSTTLHDPEIPSTDFLLLLGDFIYADVPYYFGDDEEKYSRLYRHTYASPSFRKIYENLRKYFPGLAFSIQHLTVTSTAVYHIYDDHEVRLSFVFDNLPNS